MPGGVIKWNEQAIVTLSSSIGALISNGGGVANGTANLDCRSGGNAADMLTAMFELSVLQWGTITNIISGTIVADLFLVPAADGTNFCDVDIANASTDYIPNAFRVGAFVNHLHNPSINTSYRFGVVGVDLQPLLYKPYLINRSGQTFTANAVLKVVAAQAQYT